MDADRHGPQDEAGSLRASALVFVVVCALVLPIELGMGMTRGLNHDEHQHIAAGTLIARDGLMPYRDFPHFHTPYLAYAYALLFRLSDHLLLVARMVSVLSATAILGVIGSVGYQLFRPRGKRLAVGICAGSVLLALTTALFTGTSGYALNHEPALCLSLLAFVAHVAGLRTAKVWWFGLSGALLGLAIGTRLTCAPLIAPFGLALMLYPTPRWPWDRIAIFTAALLVALAPFFYLFAVVPEQALYGNFGFAGTNIIYRFATGEPRTMTLLTKLRFFWKVIIRPDTALFVAGLLPILAACLANRGTDLRQRFELKFILFLLPFVLIGSFAPSPLFDQYFYPLVPFLLLAGLYASVSIPAESVWFRSTLLGGAAAVALSIGMGAKAFGDFRDFPVPRKWRGIESHDQGKEIRSHLANGKVLTLAPLFPLEAGLSIYPAFSTGPFAWRVSPYLDPSKAARLGIVSPTTLKEFLNAAPPAGIFIGQERTGEDLLAEYARQHGFAQQHLADENQLWIRAE